MNSGPQDKQGQIPRIPQNYYYSTRVVSELRVTLNQTVILHEIINKQTGISRKFNRKIIIVLFCLFVCLIAMGNCIGCSNNSIVYIYFHKHIFHMRFKFPILCPLTISRISQTISSVCCLLCIYGVIVMLLPS